MTTHSNYIVRPYTSADNAGLAVMWNESDDQWPGTFTEGVPMTEERVREWMERETCLMRLVVEDQANGSLVGYGSLLEEPGHESSCYVDLLNVHPAHQKRSLARRILTQMVDWATDNDYGRVTIGTWSGNLKSVPLYKKVGFFWIPDTQVYMENFVPVVRQLSVAQRFFERHDWYRTFKRELKQVEDEQRHPATGDMKVYIYRWEEDGEYLEAIIDRQAQALTGLETSDFAAYAIVAENEPAQGITYPVRWRITNKQTEPISVSVVASGETGIELNYQTSLDLAAGEERIVEATFTCATDAPRLDADKDKPAPAINTTLVIGGDLIELGTGVRYHPAVEISTEPEFPSLLPNQSRTIHLQLRNRAGRPLRGTVMIVPQEDLVTDWPSQEYQVEENSYAGLPLAVTCTQDGATPLLVRATFVDGERQVTTEPQRVPLLVTALGGLTADRDEDVIVVENDFFRLTAQAKGGRCRLWNKVLRRHGPRILEEAGPPFEPSDLPNKQYDLALTTEPGGVKLTLRATSGNFFGLTLEREVIVTASPLVQVRYRAVNNGLKPHKFRIKPSLWLSDGETTRTALPRQERLVVEHASEFPSSHGDIPKEPEHLAEQWLAFDGNGQVTGAIWNKEIVEHEFWWGSLHLHFADYIVEPQSALNVGPLYLYVGPGDWRDVRRVWQRTVGTANQGPEILPEPARPYTFDLSPTPLVTLNNHIETTLCLDSVRERAIEGRLIVEPPSDWQVDRNEFPVESLTRDNALTETLYLTATQDRLGPAEGRLHLETTLFDEVRPFVVIRLGNEATPVHVEVEEEAEQETWTITNGRCTWTVAPNFHAGVIAWREMGSDVNHLMTAFPDDGKLGWLKPWFGGIRPTLMLPQLRQGWPGKLHEETFAAAPLEMADSRGILWHGIQTTAALTRERFEGLRTEIAYLTVGGSNVLKVVYRLVNTTSAVRRVVPGLLAFWQVDGQHETSVLYADDLQRKRTPHMAWPLGETWGAVVNPSSERAAVMVGASGQKQVQVIDWGVDGGHLNFSNDVVLAPNGSYELVAYLALSESLVEAKQYACLAA